MEFPDLSDGLCRQVGVDFFYPEAGDTSYSFARIICGGCTVKSKCLEWALKHEAHGMWGGTTPLERKKLRRKLKIKFEDILLKEYI